MRKRLEGKEGDSPSAPSATSLSRSRFADELPHHIIDPEWAGKFTLGLPVPVLLGYYKIVASNL